MARAARTASPSLALDTAESRDQAEASKGGVAPERKIGMCGRIGTTELLLIVLLVVLVFGAGRLPEVGRGLGLGIRRFKKALGDEGDEEKKKGKE